MSTPIEQNTTALEELLEMVEALPDAGEPPVLQEKSVSPSTNEQTVTPDSGYDGLSKVNVGAMPTATLATPSISVSTSGLITAIATQTTAGYVGTGTKTTTKQLTTQAAQTITPGNYNKTIASGRYLTGTQTIEGDSNLVPENIKKGVSIFDVTGTLEATSGGGGSSNLRTGAFTVSTNLKTPYTFSHDLGVAPDFVFVFIEDNYELGDFVDHQIFNFIMRKDFTSSNSENRSFSGFECLISAYQHNTYPMVTPLTADNINAKFTSSTVTISAGAFYILKYGITYRWVVGTLS